MLCCATKAWWRTDQRLQRARLLTACVFLRASQLSRNGDLSPESDWVSFAAHARKPQSQTVANVLTLFSNGSYSVI